MKYMTKKWYETMQKTDLYLLLRVSKKAEVFSEDYYRKLYKREEKKWLELQREISEVGFEDIYPEEFSGEYIDGAILEGDALEEARKAYYERREEAKKYFSDRSAFDPEQEKKNFRRSVKNNIAVLKKKLPEEILQKTADIRVLALNKASLEVKREITKYCRQNEKLVRSAMDAYQRNFMKQFGKDSPDFVKKLALHDCEVISCRREGKDIVLSLDNSGGFTDICKIRLKNCAIIKVDSQLSGAWCLYEEIYKTGDRYELHFLMQKKELIDFIVSVDDVLYRYDK